MTDTLDTPKALFLKCKEKSKRITKESVRSMMESLVQELAFHRKLFSPIPRLGGSDATPAKSSELKNVLHNSFASRYQGLIQLLKKYSDKEARWIVLALWLKQEGICQPGDILPEDIYRRLTSADRKRTQRISRSDCRYYFAIEAWKPYFDRLISDRRNLGKATGDVKATLIRSGYDEQAIEAAAQKRAAIPAACEWLAQSGGPDAFTLRNAHSRFSKPVKSAKSQNR